MTTIVYTGNSSINPPFPVQRSVRFRGVTGTNFTRTFGTATSTTVYTWSAWVKRGDALTGATNLAIFGVAGNQYFGFNTSNQLILQAGASSLTSTPVYRDPASWYHIVWSRNGTSNTMYVNGVSVLTGTLSSGINSSGLQHCLGNATSGGTTSLFNGYLTQVNFVDGQALTPSAFGAFNGTTGVWEPRKYGGTFGNNGFFLPFTGNSSTTNLGLDFSGMNNNWTPSAGISVTAGTTYDSMIDVPGLPTNSAANYPTLNPLASANFSGTYSNSNLNFISGVAGQWRGAVATQFLTSGKFYFEATIQVLGAFNYTMIGACGLQTSISLFSNYTGSVANGWSVQSGTTSGGTRYNGGSGVNIANAAFTQFVLNDVLQCAVDVTNGRIWFGKNNVWLEGDPAAGTGASYTNLTGPIAPSISCFDTTAQLAANFGQRPFTYTPPTGFKSVNSYNLGMPSIPNGATQFAATLYTGNGTSQSIVNTANGKSFQPDLVWIKGRSGATDHALYDSVRGTTKQLESNTTTAETTEATGLTAFGSAGFTVGALAQMNTNAATYVGWQWKASNAAAVSNTSGSISSQVSANPSAGFSIVTYTGTGANATVGHGLGIAPKMFFIFNRTTGFAYSHPVWHTSFGGSTNTDYMYLDSTIAKGGSGAASFWNATAPTSTTISLGTDITVNRSTNTYVAYCFSEIAGFSSFGRYTGNGVADGIFIYTGFRPRFIMIKSIGVESWIIRDASRNTYNVADADLFPNLSDAETVSSATRGTDFLSNGFKLRNTGTGSNSSGVTYIYAAFAENPFQYALAR